MLIAFKKACMIIIPPRKHEVNKLFPQCGTFKHTITVHYDLVIFAFFKKKYKWTLSVWYFLFGELLK